MKIILEDLSPGEEEQIIIKCHELRPEMLKLINKLKIWDSFLIGYAGNGVHRLSPADINYIEAVDRKVFIYDESTAYESRQKLYELEETLAIHDFIRVSKSVLVNLRKIKSIIPSFSGRMEAVLQNGEKVICSRQYISELKSLLGM